MGDRSTLRQAQDRLVIRDWKISLVVCCTLAAAATPAPAQERLGRLFFTPAQRTSLDVARSQRARTTLATETTDQEAAPVPQAITYSGVLRRSDGKTTVWINNQPVHDRDSAGAAAIVGRVRSDGSVTLQVPQSGRRVTLKPGQSIELLSGAVEEGYSRRLEAPKPTPKPTGGAAAAKAAAADDAARREREEREAQRLEDAIARALVETASARPLATPAPAVPAKP